MTDLTIAPWLDAAALLTIALLAIFVVTPLLVRWFETPPVVRGPIRQDDVDEVRKP